MEYKLFLEGPKGGHGRLIEVNSPFFSAFILGR